MSIPVRYEDSTGIIGWAIRCEQSDEDTAGDIAEYAAQIKDGSREVYDDDGEVVDYTTITDEQATEFARQDIEEGDWGRDGWNVSWVHIDEATHEIEYRGGDRAEAMTLFPTQKVAVAFAEALAAEGTTESMEVWAIVAS